MRRSYLATRNSRWEEFKEECIAEGKSSVWTLGTKRETNETVAKEEAGRLGTENLQKKHGLPEANHCSRWREWRIYFVVRLPALQQFSSGGLYLVGIDRKEALQLVVCTLLRKILMDSTQQDSGGADWHRRR